MIRRPIAIAAASLVALSCADRHVTVSALPGVTPVEQPPCPAYRPVDRDPFALARQVIDATQAWDVAALCALVGVPQVPIGLVQYHLALDAGQTTDLELVGRKVDEELAMFKFDVPAAGGAALVTFGFHRQGGGWALIWADYRER